MKADFEDAVDVQAANERLAKMGIVNGNGLLDAIRSNNPAITMHEAEMAQQIARARGTTSVQIVDVDRSATPATEPRSPTGKRIRRDAGKSRPKPEAPAPAQAGPLTEQQWARVNVYFDRVSQSAADLARAERSHTALLAEAHSYLDSLKGGA